MLPQGLVGRKVFIQWAFFITLDMPLVLSEGAPG